MFLFRLFIIYSACLSTMSHAAGSNAYAFDSDEDYLSSAVHLPNWSATLTRHENQKGDLSACPTNKKACRGRLRSFNRVMSKARSLNTDEQLSLVHFYINRSEYDKDRIKRIYDENGNKIGIQRTDWSTLYEFLTGGGDCEDYAAAKYFMLRALGFSTSELRIVVTYERNLHGYHAVLAWQRPDGEVWLLDSDNAIRKRSHHRYRYVYAMNEDSVWDHRADYPGPELGPHLTNH